MRRELTQAERDQIIVAAMNAETDYAPKIAESIAENVGWVVRCHFKLGLRPTKDDPGIANVTHRYLVLRKDGAWGEVENVQPDRLKIRSTITDKRPCTAREG